MKTRVIELIITEQRIGLGQEGDPIRSVTQLWTKDGELVAEQDTKESYAYLDLIK